MGTATAELAEPRTAASARPASCGEESMSSRGLAEDATARRERRAMRIKTTAITPTTLAFEEFLATGQPRTGEPALVGSC